MAATGREGRRAAWRRGLAAGLALATAAAPAAADADVLEVGADGATLVRAGAGQVRWADPAAGFTDDDGADPLAGLAVPAGATLSTASRAPAPYAAAVARIAARHRLSPALLEAVAWHESRWRADAVSSAGAIGLVQLMPATARALGVDPRDPVANLEGGARFLRQLLDRFGGDVELALAAYDAGPARVARAGGIPAIAETRAYVAAILARLASTPSGD